MFATTTPHTQQDDGVATRPNHEAVAMQKLSFCVTSKPYVELHEALALNSLRGWISPHTLRSSCRVLNQAEEPGTSYLETPFHSFHLPADRHRASTLRTGISQCLNPRTRSSLGVQGHGISCPSLREAVQREAGGASRREM